MNLSNYIHSKIYDFSLSKIDILDLKSYSQAEIQDSLKNELTLIIDNIENNKEICYDIVLKTIFDLYYELKISCDNKQLEKLSQILLEKEKCFPFEAISKSLIFIFVHFINDNFYTIEQWQKLYYNENKHLKFIFGCGILKYDFDIDIYSDIVKNTPHHLILNMVLQCKILPIEEIGKINNSLSDDLKNKIYSDYVNMHNNKIVLN